MTVHGRSVVGMLNKVITVQQLYTEVAAVGLHNNVVAPTLMYTSKTRTQMELKTEN